jgi:hypothetical protein
VSRETLKVSKETHKVSKETHKVSKETWNANFVLKFHSPSTCTCSQCERIWWNRSMLLLRPARPAAPAFFKTLLRYTESVKRDLLQRQKRPAMEQKTPTIT